MDPSSSKVPTAWVRNWQLSLFPLISSKQRTPRAADCDNNGKSDEILPAAKPQAGELNDQVREASPTVLLYRNTRGKRDEGKDVRGEKVEESEVGEEEWKARWCRVDEEEGCENRSNRFGT